MNYSLEDCLIIDSKSLEEDIRDNPELMKSQDLSIQNVDSNFLQLYEFRTPFSITMENCCFSSDRFHLHRIFPGRAIKHIFPVTGFPNYANRPLHQHNSFEIMFVLSGMVSHCIENHHFTYQAGQCCIVNRNINHCEEFSSDFQALFFQLTPEFASQIFERDLYYYPDGTCKKRKTSIYQLFNKNRRQKDSYEKIYLDFLPIVTAGQILELVMPLFQQIITDMTRQTPGYFCMVQSLLSRFFSYLEDPALFSFSEIHADVKVQEFLFTKLTLILEANHGRVTRKELENLLSYNSDYLNRIVKKYTSMNLTEYGQTFYLEDAKKMLIETDMTISEIIHELGFLNRSHFYRIFEKKYGSTPKEFRRINANIH